MGRAVGIDFGTKRVGVAISDPLGLFAQPFGTYDQDGAVSALQRLYEDDGIDVFVIGWPVTENGASGTSTARVQEYANRLSNRFPGVRIVRWDERYSTQRARDLLKQGSRPSLRKSGRERVDTAVAGLLLQEFLDEGGDSDVS